MRSRTIMVMFAGVLLVASAALAGCDQIVGNAVKGAVEKSTGVSVNQQKGQITVQGQNGTSVTVGSSQTQVPEGFPTEFPQYPGAVVKNGTKVVNGQGGIYTVTWTTTDPLSTVVASYKDKLKAAQYQILNEAQATGEGKSGAVLNFKSATQEGVVTVTSESGETKIVAVVTVK